MDLESGNIRWRSSLPQPSTQTDQPGLESGDSWKKLLDPQDPDLRKWNENFLVISVLSAFFVDPLFLYTSVYDNNKKCIDVDYGLTIALCTLRSALDLFYYYDVILQFKHHSKFQGFFTIWVALPVLQVASSTGYPFMGFIVQFQARIIKLNVYYISSMKHSRMLPDLFPGNSSAGSLLLCMLASNVLGALWYTLTTVNVKECWVKACDGHHCDPLGLYCNLRRTGDYSFLNSSCPLLEPNEIKLPSDYNFGIYLEALQSGLLEKQNRVQRISYGFWWGLRNLSSLGQNIKTSTSVFGAVFPILISITGLYLFATVIYSIQNSVKSILANDKKRKALRQDENKIERWMSSCMLPENLRHRIRQVGALSFEEDAVIRNFPKDLRRDVIRHLCLDILTSVLMFAKMDDCLTNTLCDHLEPVSFTENKYLCREGEPIDKMFFLTKGNILSTRTNGGSRTCVSIDLREGYYSCGEKLIPWALDPNSCSTLPASNRTIQSVKDVEGFALKADDLKFLANQFRRLDIEKVQHILRFHSESWRRWSARIIQTAWLHNRCKKRDNSARFIQAVWHLNRWKKRGMSARFIQAIWRRKKLEQSLRENEGRQQAEVGTSATRT